ncbi:Oidioi.mRNA.OKI2018_I69.chr2.g5339.t1.cds [Oikopleura dioica]|uniref:Oidioi.mRNA.OKI2018_I69.chr2.g5339.t1.cds n=1 Tax=Oikopleura dioica TaxID=34765 RepID=A0ABN7SZL5_OIKDI|nr:Oidioi.mRNA.OKI2018_I69.chr2.g5339.t1.cds [Oikopleura dioica]
MGIELLFDRSFMASAKEWKKIKKRINYGFILHDNPVVAKRRNASTPAEVHFPPDPRKPKRRSFSLGAWKFSLVRKDKEKEELGARERPKALWKNAGAKVITANKVIQAIRPDLKRVEEGDEDVFDSNVRFQENLNQEDDLLRIMLEDCDLESEADPTEDPFYDEFL